VKFSWKAKNASTILRFESKRETCGPPPRPATVSKYGG